MDPNEEQPRHAKPGAPDPAAWGKRAGGVEDQALLGGPRSRGEQ